MNQQLKIIIKTRVEAFILDTGAMSTIIDPEDIADEVMDQMIEDKVIVVDEDFDEEEHVAQFILSTVNSKLRNRRIE